MNVPLASLSCLLTKQSLLCSLSPHTSEPLYLQAAISLLHLPKQITEHPELEWTLKDHEVKLLALHRQPQESHHVPGSTVQKKAKLNTAFLLKRMI